MILVINLILVLFLGRLFLTFLQRKGYTQPIYADALESHNSKAGTPTMGGIIIIVSILIMEMSWYMISGNIDLRILITLFLIIFGYGFIGFKDDVLKVTKNDNQSGLTPLQKLIFQFLISGIVIFVLYSVSWDTSIKLFSINIELGLLYYVLVPIMLVAFSNATNLTDGLDGLLSSVSIVSFASLLLIVNTVNSNYNVSVMIIIISIFGFLIYNKYPAKMFMGDTGSLVIGAIFAFICILLKIEILSLLLGFVFLMETISVMIQVGYFKYTKKKTGEGKRVFLVAPYHHHLERKGFSEVKIVVILSTVQFIASLTALFIYFGG